MSGSIIVSGSTWHRWEWYALNRYTKGVARVGLVNVHDERGEDFYRLLGERSCHMNVLHASGKDDVTAWTKGQNIIILEAQDKNDYHLFQERGIDHALKNFFLDGGIILAAGTAAGLLFSWGVDQEGQPFRGMEFLQGSFCPQYEKFTENILPLVAERKISSGWGVESWAGLHFRGRHLQRALALDETARVFRLREGGAEMVEEVDLVPY